MSVKAWIQELFFRILNLESRIWIQELFCRILNLESRKLCKVCKVFGIQDSRFKILRKSSWVQILRSWGCRCQWRLGFKNFFSESWILNPEFGFKNFFAESWILNPENFAKFVKFLGFKIQDSRFSEKVLESKSLDLGVVDVSEGLDSRTFFSESWILNLESRKLCKVCKVFGIQDSRFSEKVLESKFWIQDSRFKILKKSSWIQILRSWDCRCQWRLGFKNFFQNLESWIQKTLQSLQSFWDSRFKIILGDSMCVCVYVCVCVRECLHGYWSSIIYIYVNVC